MFKFQSIEMDADYLFGYGEGAKPGIKCVVTMQTGERFYEKTEFKLPPEAVERIVKAALVEVAAMIDIDYDAVDVLGTAPPPKPKPVVTNNVEAAHLAVDIESI